MDTRFLWGETPPPKDIQELIASSDPAAPFFADVFDGSNWRTNPTHMGGGMFVDAGSHMVDILLWLGGAPASEVVAYTGTTGRAAERFVNCQGRLTNDAAFSITCNDSVSGGDVPFYGHGRFTVFGDKGTLTADWASVMTTDATEVWIDREGERAKLDAFADTFTPADGFVASIRDGASNLCSPREAAQVVALVEAIYRSSAEHQIIQIEAL
jgi:predicted dehydrogenase